MGRLKSMRLEKSIGDVTDVGCFSTRVYLGFGVHLELVSFC